MARPRGLRIPDVPEADRSGDQEAPNLLALAAHGVHLPVDTEVNACGWDGDPVEYEAVFDVLLYDTVRGAGAQNLVVIGGLDWAYDLSGVPANRIEGFNILYATHPYTSVDGSTRPFEDWGRAWGSLKRTDPVVVTEFGVLDDVACTSQQDTRVIQYADAHLAGWTAWAWYPGGCTSTPIVDSLPPGQWVPLTLDLGAVTTTGYDARQIVQIGVTLFSGLAGGGGTFATGAGDTVLEIDAVTD